MSTSEQKTSAKTTVAPFDGPKRRDSRQFFERIYREHYESLIQLLRRLPIVSHEAEDIAQDALVRIIRQNEPEKLAEAPQAYLYRVAVNLVRDNQRRRQAQKREHQIDSERDVDQCVTPVGGPEQLVQAQQTLSQLKEAISGLPVNQQQVFILSRYHHLSTREIAEKLNVPYRTVQRHLGQAIAYCQDRVGHHHE